MTQDAKSPTSGAGGAPEMFSLAASNKPEPSTETPNFQPFWPLDGLDALRSAWGEASPEARAAFLDEIVGSFAILAFGGGQ